MRILIIDDSKTSRMFLSKTILITAGEGTELFEAENGEVALLLLNSQKIDLIVCDINMPVMNGFTFLRNVKADEKLKDVPIVFISSMANKAREVNLKALGAFDVIKKPITPSKIKEIVSKMLKQEKENNTWGQ